MGLPNKNPPKAEEIVEGRWDRFFEYVGLGEYLQFQKKEGPCPVCGGNTRFRLLKGWEESGVHYCGHCSHLKKGVGRGFTLVMAFTGWDFKRTADEVRRCFGISNDESAQYQVARLPPKVHVQQTDRSKLKAKYLRLWNQGDVIKPESAAGKYLLRRVPELPYFPATLRSHPALEYYVHDKDKGFQLFGTFPGMIGYCQDHEGNLANIWRWFLTPEGEKAAVPNPKEAKKAAGEWLTENLALRLTPQEEVGDVLGVCEGAETGLRRWAQTGDPIWPTMNATGLEKFRVPPGMHLSRGILVYGDNDEPKGPNMVRKGNESAKSLVARLKSENFKAYLRLPASTKYDFADIGNR